MKENGEWRMMKEKKQFCKVMKKTAARFCEGENHGLSITNVNANPLNALFYFFN